jgi:UDP-N-acetylmuramate dehydrogenase
LNPLNPLVGPDDPRCAAFRGAVSGALAYHVPLAEYTTWHVGGIADCVFWPNSISELQSGLSALDPEIPVLFLGLGSNVLIRDRGIRGVVVMTRYLNRLASESASESAGTIVAEAGVSCAKMARFLADCDLTQGAFLAGIPGTVGGALAMNAGAYGHEIWEFVTGIVLVTRTGGVVRIEAAHLSDYFQIGYREVKRPVDHGFVSGHFTFPSAPLALKGSGLAEIRTLLQKRNAAQPIGQFSGGSVFRNPPGLYAAQLIETAGLKGLSVGGAHVSEKHANFIISDKTACAADIEALIEMLIARVYAVHGVCLQSEVHILG